ncbi:surface lipoprotein assembly modifier [Pasteurella sp. PK-2025]|uniref:surface lipoprotein assembly modifier n=1 Tax=unclassified Pasteurella TaxID=2621516 RepID=UPI003C732DC2
MNRKLIYPVLFLSLSSLAHAQTPINDQQVREKINERLNDQRIQDRPATPLQTQAPRWEQPVKNQPAEKTLQISKEELVKYPSLVIRALLPALAQNNADHVALLLPIYRQVPSQYHDPILLKWGEAILARKAYKHGEAIRLYRQLLAEKSDLVIVRLQLAVALFENNELDAAENQFQKLGAEPLIPELHSLVQSYQQAIQRRNRWSLNGGATYLYDPNINNAPKTGTRIGNWTGPEAESASGIGVNLNIGKKWSWGNGFFNELRLEGSGKYYWDNKKYNEARGKASIGIGFQNVKGSLTLLPFMEQVIYAGGSKQSDTLKRFSKSHGITLEADYWITPKWQFNHSYEYSDQTYVTRKHLNGHSHFISAGITYLANAKQYWFANLNFNDTYTRDPDDSFIRRGAVIGWGQEWGKGLSTRLSLSYAKKHYKGPMIIFLTTQRNQEYGVNVSVWHRAIHYLGVTPRLTYSYNKVKSNHVFSTYDKHRAFIELSKRF